MKGIEVGPEAWSQNQSEKLLISWLEQLRKYEFIHDAKKLRPILWQNKDDLKTNPMVSLIFYHPDMAQRI